MLHSCSPPLQYPICLCQPKLKEAANYGGLKSRGNVLERSVRAQGDGRYCTGNFYANLDCATGLPSPERAVAAGVDLLRGVCLRISPHAVPVLVSEEPSAGLCRPD
jgi:hypothetical protein